MKRYVSEKEKIKSVAVETENDILIGNSAIEVKSLEQHDRELLEELEVYKRALEKMSEKLADRSFEYYVGNMSYEEYLLKMPKEFIGRYLNQARKELEDESSTL